MWRNFGWMAILATWTIFLVSNSGLAGEWIPSNSQNNNEHTSHKVSQEARYSVFNKKVIDDSRLQYAKINFKSNGRSSVYIKPVSLEFKNTENRDSQFSGYEKHIALSNAMATTKYLKDSDDKSARMIAKRAMENMWLSKVIVTEKLKNSRNYLKFVPGLRPSPSMSQELKSTSRDRRCKEKTFYVLFNDRKKAATIRRDTQAFDKKDGRWKKHGRDRIFNGENGMTTFFPDKLTKSSRSEKDSSIQKLKNSDISQFETEDIESKHANKTYKRNKNEGDSHQSFKLTKSKSNKLIYVETNNKSQSLRQTFSNYSNSKENQSRGNVTSIVDNTITKDSPYERSVAVAWTTLIVNSKISKANEIDDKENAISPYHPSRDEYSRSYKADGFLSAELYKRDEYSKIGFKIDADIYANKKGNSNIIDSFIFHASNSLDNHLTKKRAGFTRRPFPYKKNNILKVASDTFNLQRQYHSSSISNSDTKINKKINATNFDELKIKKMKEKEIAAAANYTTHNTLEVDRGLLSTNLSARSFDESKLDYQTSERISVTQKRNPMHVRHVETDADCERPQTTDFEAEVRGAFRIGLWNVSGPSGIAKFDNLLRQKAHGRPKYLRKFDAFDSTRPPRIAETTDRRSELDGKPPRTSIEGESISFAAANVSDNSTGMRKINGRVQSSSELTDEPGLENVRVTTKRSGNHRDMHEGSGFYSRSRGVHNSKYRRYKRHQDRNTPGIPTSTELIDSKTWKTLDTTGATTSNSLIEFTAYPSISTTQTNNVDHQISISAEEAVTSVETLPSSGYGRYQKEWRPIPIMSDHDKRYTETLAKTDPDSLEIPLINIPITSNASLVETPALLIKLLDRSRQKITKIDNSIIPREVLSTTKENVRVSGAVNRNVFDASSTEVIKSQVEHGAYVNESVWTIDPFPQRTKNVIDSSTGDVLSDQWPVKHSAVVEGDLVLGGLMMVHEREDTITCGRVMPQGGVQALEAMLYTLDTLNDREIVPGVKIGAHILDDCDKDTYGLEMAVDFIKGMYATMKYNDHVFLYICISLHTFHHIFHTTNLYLKRHDGIAEF
ncbi:hypothetical protein P5V15_006054 [Pogonomyrmex californicus]